MADDFERWLHELNDAFVTSTSASLDIDEALTITKRRLITEPSTAHPDTGQPSECIPNATGKGRDTAGTAKSKGGVRLLPQACDNAIPLSPIVSSSRVLTDQEAAKRRQLLARGAAIMFGTAVLGTDRGQWLPNRIQIPAPIRISMTDVKQVEAATKAMRALDYQFGGGACLDAVISQLRWAHTLLSASSTEEVRRRLFRALGDLHNLAGWTSFDVGLLDGSRSHFATALEFAKRSGDSSLLANIMYRIGRIYMHGRDPLEALKWFQLGQLAAQDSGSERDVSLLCVNEAWAFAMIGDDAQAMKLLGRARDELARANPSEAPDWARFYNDTDMLAMIGTVHNELSDYDLRHTPIVISTLGRATARYDETMNRSQAFALTMLATAHLRGGNVDHGVQIGGTALRTACSVRSKRLSDRMRPLEIEVTRRSNNADCRKLSRTIQKYRSSCHRRLRIDPPYDEPGVSLIVTKGPDPL